MKFNRFIYLLGVMVLLVSIVGCGKASQEGKSPAAKEQSSVIILKAAHITAPNSNYQTAMVKFAELVGKKSNGKIKVDVYHSGQLGQERELVEGLQMGSVDVAVTSVAPMSNFVPEFKLFDLPYLFRDEKHAAAVSDGPIGQKMSEKLQAKGIVGLGFWDVGFRQFITKSPVKSLADAKGKKIRVMESPMFMATFSSMGTIPTPMNFGEIYTGLQQGTIDGIDVPIMTCYTSGFHPVAKSVSLTKHVFGIAPFMMSKKSYDKLTPELQKVIMEASREATDFARSERERIEKESRQAMEKEGVKFYDIDAAEWVKACEPVYEKFSKELPMDIVNQIRKS